MSSYPISGGLPYPLGAHHDGDGVNFAVFSENALRIELCLFSDDGVSEIERIPLPERTGPVWHGHLQSLPVGSLYGYRAHGRFAPDEGHRFNPHKLLSDPYTREYHGPWTSHSATFGYDADAADADLTFDTSDSAPFVAKSVVSDPALFEKITRPARPVATSDLIYEAHVKGLTHQHDEVAQALRGTYDGLATVPILNHLKGLGVGAVELLPVQAFIDDAFLVKRGLTNYWGYNTIGFFAVEPRYLGPKGLLGFREMVARCHEAGIEVILDVVYNHTGEGDHLGPTLSFRGLDNASYYRLQDDAPRFYVNDTGCGNTLNVAHPFVLRMVLDSLRFWVECMGVDGFRFDLATTLGREAHGFDPEGGFFDAVRQDPVLSQVRLIAEPWDIGPGGYRLGAFPSEFSEWNDSYRDTLRRFWRGDSHSTQELAARLLGSADRFDGSGRRATASVNFITSHDGFTLADVTRYNTRHNEANTEDNRDGHHSNYSDNCGAEGDSDDPEILQRRRLRQRNLLTTLFLSQGTPMLLAGDEIGNSQGGNNNAYCQDNPIGWLDWAGADTDLQQFVARLSVFRQAHPVLRQTRFLHGQTRAQDGLSDVTWTDFAGGAPDWDDPNLSQFCLVLRMAAETPEYAQDNREVLIAFNRAEGAVLTLPDVPQDEQWIRAIDSADDTSGPQQGAVQISGPSVVAFVRQPSGNRL